MIDRESINHQTSSDEPSRSRRSHRKSASCDGNKDIATGGIQSSSANRGSDETSPRSVSNKSSTTSTTTASAEPDVDHDPHNIYERFVEAHQGMFKKALKEIRRSRKKSHWSWFIFPTPPYRDEDGNIVGSSMNRYYALETPEAGDAFLTFPTTEGVNLRRNYITILNAVADQIEFVEDMTLSRLVGDLDDAKVISSAKYFFLCAIRLGDNHVASACTRLLTLIDEPLPLLPNTNPTSSKQKQKPTKQKQPPPRKQEKEKGRDSYAFKRNQNTETTAHLKTIAEEVLGI